MTIPDGPNKGENAGLGVVICVERINEAIDEAYRTLLPAG